MTLLSFLLIAVFGAFIASFLALIPALHIYNVITLAFLFAGALRPWLQPDQLSILLLGMITGYAVFTGKWSMYVEVECRWRAHSNQWKKLRGAVPA